MNGYYLSTLPGLFTDTCNPTESENLDFTTEFTGIPKSGMVKCTPTRPVQEPCHGRSRFE
jgi:hypothetical protein